MTITVTDEQAVLDAYRACEALTRARAANFYYGIRLLPSPKRRAMCAVYAFARQVDDIGDGSEPPERKRVLLAAARTDLESENGSPMRLALSDAERRFALPRDALVDLIDGVEMDIRGDTYNTFPELVVYCRRVAGSIGGLWLAIFGASDMEAAVPLADDLGVAMQLTNILRDVREDLDRGRVYLPADDRSRFGCENLEAAAPDAFAQLMTFEVRRAREWFDRGLRLLPLIDGRSASCVSAMTGIYRRILDRIDRSPQAVLDHGLSLAPWEKTWVALRSLAGASPVSGSRVVVVGGGLAGISAALDCARADVSVTLVEVRPRLGGAVYSFQRDGLWLDNGQHVFLRCCDSYRALLERLGSTGDTVLQDRLTIPVLAPGRPPVLFRRGNLPAPFHLARSLLRYRHLRVGQRLSAALTARALGRVDTDQPAADEKSFGTWLSEHGQSPEAVDALWELIGRPTLNLRAGDASLAAAAFVFRAGLLERADAGDIGYAHRPLQRIHGDAALRVLRAKGVDVRLGWRASMIEASHDRGMGVTGPDERIEADAVVLAVPHERAARLLPEGAVRNLGALERLGTSPIVNLHLCYDRRVLDLEFVAAINSPVQYVFDRTESAGLERGQCLAVSLSAADAEVGASAEELRCRFERAMADLLPAARGARIERFVVTREHAATFRAAPGHRALRPAARTAFDGLTLAGSFTDTGWPATMEGAVRSGHAAAVLALASLGSERAVTEVAA